MRSTLLRILAVLTVAGTPVTATQAQPLRLSGINSVGTDVNGNIVGAYWTSDHTPTPNNWFGTWVSTTPSGSFISGSTQADLNLWMSVGTNNFYAVADFAPPHSGRPSYVAFNLFFAGELAPRISFVTPTSNFGSYLAIAAGTQTPTLLYWPFTTTSGVTSFVDNGYSYSLSGFTSRLGDDCVYANQTVPDGYDDPEFHFSLDVASTTVPEPSTWILMGCGLLAIGARRSRRPPTAVCSGYNLSQRSSK